MPRPGHRDGQERFPHGPRHLESGETTDQAAAPEGAAESGTGAASKVKEAASMAGPSPRHLDTVLPVVLSAQSSVRNTRRKRSVVVSDRKVRSRSELLNLDLCMVVLLRVTCIF